MNFVMYVTYSICMYVSEQRFNLETQGLGVVYIWCAVLAIGSICRQQYGTSWILIDYVYL